MLARKGWVISTGCPVCGCNEEIVSWLFFDAPFFKNASGPPLKLISVLKGGPPIYMRFGPLGVSSHFGPQCTDLLINLRSPCFGTYGNRENGRIFLHQQRSIFSFLWKALHTFKLWDHLGSDKNYRRESQTMWKLILHMLCQISLLSCIYFFLIIWINKFGGGALPPPNSIQNKKKEKVTLWRSKVDRAYMQMFASLKELSEKYKRQYRR